MDIKEEVLTPDCDVKQDGYDSTSCYNACGCEQNDYKECNDKYCGSPSVSNSLTFDRCLSLSKHYLDMYQVTRGDLLAKDYHADTCLQESISWAGMAGELTLSGNEWLVGM